VYSQKFRDKVVQRMLSKGGPPMDVLAVEIGVAKSTLYRWRHASVGASMTDDDDTEALGPKPLRDLGAMEKARLLFEADALGGQELGAWLRSRGLRAADLEQWRQAIEAALDPATTRAQRRAAAKQQRTDARRIKKLERELRKKDKALAEAAAILVLRKKARALWGDEDDDTDPS
jgi:transposase